MKLGPKQIGLLSNFLANIGVAWFAGGIVGTFFSEQKDVTQIITYISWGFILSTIFILSGILLIRD